MSEEQTRSRVGWSVRGMLVLVVLLLVWGRLGPRQAAGTGFDADTALADLHDLLGESPRPRIPGSDAHRTVGDGILARLRSSGLEPEVQDTFACAAGRCARVRNIVAHVAGPPTERVLLVAHYDSVGAGLGIADDAQGVAIALRAAALATGRDSRNGLAVLFTDAEELGLLGAEAFVRDHPWASDLGAVVNVEARGSRGRSWLFETSEPTGWITRVAEQSIGNPVMSSLAFEIYRRLPNDTDLSVFKRAGVPGANFAFIEGVEHYHTPLDDFAHVDPRSVQQQGDQAIALWLGLGDVDFSAVPEGNDVYADLFGLTIVRWPLGASLPLAIGLSVMVVALTGLALFRREATLGHTVLAGLGVPVFLGVVVGLSVVVQLGLDAADGGFGVAWPFRVGMWALVGAAATATIPLWVRLGHSDRWAAVWGWSAAGALALAWFAPGASYLLILPLGWAIVFQIGGQAVRREPWAWALAGSVLGLALWFELAFVLETSLGLLAPGLVLPLALVALFLVPSVERIGRGWGASTAALAVLAGLGALWPLAGPAGTDARPQRVTFTHVQTGQQAVWHASAGAPPEGFSTGTSAAGLPYLGRWARAASVRPAPPPGAVWDGTHLAVSSQRGATSFGLSLPRGTHVRLDGREVQHRGVVTVDGAGSVQVELSAVEGVRVFDAVLLDELPPEVVRGRGGVQSQWGDRSLVFGTLVFANPAPMDEGSPRLSDEPPR